MDEMAAEGENTCELSSEIHTEPANLTNLSTDPPTTTEELTKTEEVPVKIPKRRGRKRKSEMVVPKIDNVAPEENTPRRRGRPRKSVNYYALANPDDFLDESEPSKSSVNSDTEELKINETRGRRKVYKGAVKAHEEESGATNPDDNLEKSNTNTSLQHAYNSKLDCDSTAKENGYCEKGSPVAPPNKSESQVFESLSNSNGDKKYQYHGQTITMMNTLFTLFKDDGKEKSAANTINNLAPPQRNKRGRKKKVVTESAGSTHIIPDQITCAICSEKMSKTLWCHHKQRYHNNLAWRTGDAPLDLSDQSLVLYILNDLYKKKKPLYCDKCGDFKKSVVGFLSHQSQCKKSGEQLNDVKVSCKICGKKVLPVSMMTHMKFVHTENKNKNANEERQSGSSSPVSLPSKRNAAKKALQVIEEVTKNDLKQEKHFTADLDFSSHKFVTRCLEKELSNNLFIKCKFKNCNFECRDVEELLNHFNECTFKPSDGFACKECLHITDKYEEMICHLELVHDFRVPYDHEMYSTNNKEHRNINAPRFLPPTNRLFKQLFTNAFDWTFKFHQEHFSELLFENFMPSQSTWPVLPFNRVADYLPRMSESCDVARTYANSVTNDVFKEDYTFKKYELFETDLHEDGKYTLFCGGPVTSLAWLPIPYSKMDESQILAVAVLNSPEEVYLVNQNYHEAFAIQFWNFGSLSNQTGPNCEPKLIFNLAHNHGPVWHMEWCPSGCYNPGGDPWSRVGLLAMASSNPCVYIYSIPLLGENREGLYYIPKPVLKLKLQKLNSQESEYYPCKISWSKAAGNSFIAVGYSNGFVGIFNINTRSPLLRQRDVDGVEYILPYNCAQLHKEKITALVLHHLHGGNRWLVTGSADRRLSLWDLENFTFPLSTCKKNIVTDGFWFGHWLCYFVGQDEGTTTLKVRTSLHQARDFLNDTTTSVTFSNATISSISGSDWLNATIQGNTVGEITGLLCQQLLLVNELAKISRKRRMLFGYTHLLDKELSPQQRHDSYVEKRKVFADLSSRKNGKGVRLCASECADIKDFSMEPYVYHEAEHKYGLLFCDNKMESLDNFPESSSIQLTALNDTTTLSEPNLYPLKAINKLTFNPNRQASLYYAAGYQAGFVRVTWMKFLRNDAQIK